MKKPHIPFSVLFILLIFNFESFCQTPTPLLNRVIKDKNSNEILIGACNMEVFKGGLFKEWFDPEFDYYKVDTTTSNEVKLLLTNRSLIVFIGTWCDDSKREFPRLIKILQYCNFPLNNLSIIALGNRDTLYKKSLTGLETGRNIVYIPTIVIEENQKEIGRIVEYPVISLEKDLLKILRKEKYKPNYSTNLNERK